jgi:DUF971 family protein
VGREARILFGEKVDAAGQGGQIELMRPTDIQQIGTELAIKWDDGSESFIGIEALRRHCPCAGCKGEVDIMGNLYKNPERPLTPEAFHLIRIDRIGGYALQPVWGDGHMSGIYSFDYLRRVAEG